MFEDTAFGGKVQFEARRVSKRLTKGAGSIPLDFDFGNTDIQLRREFGVTAPPLLGAVTSTDNLVLNATDRRRIRERTAVFIPPVLCTCPSARKLGADATDGRGIR